jgi:hypothetical protein
MASITDSLRGIYRDVLRGRDGRLLYDSGWRDNTIVDSCRVLLAGFMGNAGAAGIQSLAVGEGDPAWDLSGAPAPDPATTDLVRRYTPAVEDLSLEYLDAADAVVPGPTSRLQVTARLVPGYPTPRPGMHSYPLREFGLFGRLDGSDFMVDCIRHPVIHKHEAAALIRVVRLYL